MTSLHLGPPLVFVNVENRKKSMAQPELVAHREIEELFPAWLTGRIIMGMWIDSITGWDLDFVDGAVMIAPASPFVIQYLVPLEDWARVQEIFAEVLGLYYPLEELETFLAGGPMRTVANQMSFQHILYLVRQREQEILTYRSFKDALRHYFGLATQITVTCTFNAEPRP